MATITDAAPKHDVIIEDLEYGRVGDTAVLALDFRMPPAAVYPASVADINLGIRWLKANAARLGGDPRRVGGLGGSSGGHQLWLNVLRPHHPRYTALKLA